MQIHRSCRATIVLAAVATLSLSALARDDDDQDREAERSQIRIGYRIVPFGVKLNMKGKNPALVGLGSYVVNTSGCNDCHTHPEFKDGGNPFLGQPEMINAPVYLSGGRQFGPITSANITPNANGLPAGLTRTDFITMLRTGHNPNDAPGTIVQVMPWPVFGKKTDRELNAIYEYLRAIPSLQDNPAPGP